MQDELTEAMHSGFTRSPERERKHDAFAVFGIVNNEVTLAQACALMRIPLERVRPYVDEWNGLLTKQIMLD